MSGASAFDLQAMRRALELAERGAGYVEPNPMVGAVVARDGTIIGAGWHERFGGPHAEVAALAAAGAAARGATLYVTLEPCCHQGKTPPCTTAIIAAGRTTASSTLSPSVFATIVWPLTRAPGACPVWIVVTPKPRIHSMSRSRGL
jgi:pyrimidine deaminase RibD-like protein